MAVHARLKNEFTEDEKYHNLMTWPFDHADGKLGGPLGAFAAELPESQSRAWDFGLAYYGNKKESSKLSLKHDIQYIMVLNLRNALSPWTLCDMPGWKW